MPQVMHDSALAVRRPGECTFFTPGCEIEVDKVEFTPEMVRVRCFCSCSSHQPRLMHCVVSASTTAGSV